MISETAFIGGKYVEQFEKEFCQGVALDLPKGSEIIVPANSFIASSESVTSSIL